MKTVLNALRMSVLTILIFTVYSCGKKGSTVTPVEPPQKEKDPKVTVAPPTIAWFGEEATTSYASTDAEEVRINEAIKPLSGICTVNAEGLLEKKITFKAIKGNKVDTVSVIFKWYLDTVTKLCKELPEWKLTARKFFSGGNWVNSSQLPNLSFRFKTDWTTIVSGAGGTGNGTWSLVGNNMIISNMNGTLINFSQSSFTLEWVSPSGLLSQDTYTKQ